MINRYLRPSQLQLNNSHTMEMVITYYYLFLLHKHNNNKSGQPRKDTWNKHHMLLLQIGKLYQRLPSASPVRGPISCHVSGQKKGG